MNTFQWFFLLVLGYSSSTFAVTQRQVGDAGRYVIPLTGVLFTAFHKDLIGFGQLALSMATVQGATEGLKAVAREKRPDGGSYNSFPSGHTSAAFTGAAFVNFRYSFAYSVPLYLGSIYVAYSRVNANAHYPQDVVAGALLGIGGTYLLTTKYGQDLSVVSDGSYAGILYRKIFD